MYQEAHTNIQYLSAQAGMDLGSLQTAILSKQRIWSCFGLFYSVSNFTIKKHILSMAKPQSPPHQIATLLDKKTLLVFKILSSHLPLITFYLSVYRQKQKNTCS